MSTKIERPTPPAAPSTAESIQAYTEGLPAMYQAQLDWAPKLEAQQYETALQYMPQYTELQQQQQLDFAPALAQQNWEMQQQYAPQYAQQAQEMQQQYEPEAYAAKQAMGTMMTPEYMGGPERQVATDPMLEQMRSTMTPEWMSGYQAEEAPGFMAAKDRLRQDVRGAWAGRGMAQSGMSAEDESRLMAEMEYPYAMQQEALTQQVAAQRQGLGAQIGTQGLQAQQNAWQNYYTELGRRQNVGLSMAGRYAVPNQAQVSTPQVQTSQFQPQNLMQGYNYGQVAGDMQQGYGNYAGLYGNMYSSNQKQAQSDQQTMQEYIKMGMGGAGQMMAMSSKRYKKNIKLWGKPSIYSNN